MRIAPKIVLTELEKVTLERWARGRSTQARLVGRANIVLLAADGKENREIATETGFTRPTVGLWRTRFAVKRIAGIEKDAPRGGRRPTRANRLARQILERTTQTKPKNATHWSVRTMAAATGVSCSMVHRIWRSHNLQPHRVRTFKISRDPDFIEKVTDIVGLYLNPPERALVFCADEKSQIQALDRTQPGLPLKPGRCGTMTHDYKRNGTTTLFAAIEMAEGRLIGTCMPRHRHQEWIKFLEVIDHDTPATIDLHLIVDNYATHKHPRVKRWIKNHPRFHIHFIPTSSSWLNLIERWFRDLTDRRIRRGVFHSVIELISAITDYIAAHNENPETFKWTANAGVIIEKVERAKRVLINQHQSETLH